MTTYTPSTATNETDTATPAEDDAAVIAACVERLQFNDDPLFRRLVEIAQRQMRTPPPTDCPCDCCGGRGDHLTDCPEIGALE